MAREQEPWPVEEIPDSARLFRRVHKNHVDSVGIMPVAVKDRGLSVDWDKYSTASKTRKGGPQAAENYGVVSMVARAAREVPGQVVVHTPDASTKNRAHSEVKGEKDPEVRLKLLRLCTWEIRVED